MKIVAIVPTYNEQGSIRFLSEQILAQDKHLHKDKLILLIADSHSNDGTLEIVSNLSKKNPLVKLLDVHKRGIGVGLYKGYQYAFDNLKADAVVQLDADLQHDPAVIPRFIKEIKKGADLVQGSRFIKGGKNNLEWHRRFFSWTANLLARLLFGLMPIREFTTSYRAFTRKVYQTIDWSQVPWRGRSFIFQPAMLYAVADKGFKIVEIPIVFTDRKKDYSKMDTLRYGFDLLSYGIRVRLKKSITFSRFCVVGFTGTALDFSLLIVGVEHLKLTPTMAKAISVAAAIINNFLMNNFWTFKDRLNQKHFLRKFADYFLVSAVGFSLAVVLMALATGLFGPKYYLIYNIFIIPIVMFWNFFANSKYTFKQKAK